MVGGGGDSIGTFFTVTFNTPFAVAPNPTFSPANTTAAQQIVSKSIQVVCTATSLSLTGSSGIGVGTLVFNFTVPRGRIR